MTQERMELMIDIRNEAVYKPKEKWGEKLIMNYEL